MWGGLSTVSWITDSLTGAPHYVCMKLVSFDMVVRRAGAPKSSALLFSFLFTLYTNNWHATMQNYFRLSTPDAL